MELKGKVVFVVSGDSSVTHPIREFLLKHAFQVIVVDSPSRVAVHMSTGSSPDAVVLDVRPEESLWVRPWIKKWSRTTLVVVLAEKTTPELCKAFVESGARRVLLKTNPFSPERLVNVLFELLQSAREYQAVHRLQKQVDVAFGMISALKVRAEHG